MSSPRTIHVLCLTVLTCAMLAACAAPRARSFTIGIVNEAPVATEMMRSFSAALTEGAPPGPPLVRLVYREDASEAPGSADGVLARVLEERPDAVIAFGRSSIAAARKALSGSDLPVLFVPALDPVGTGLVKSLRNPGGNMTGVYLKVDTGKLIEWITYLTPDVKTLFILRGSSPEASGPGLDVYTRAIVATAPSLGLTPIVSALRFPEEVEGALGSLPRDTALVVLPTPSGINDFAASATRRGLPIYSFMPWHTAEGALLIYSYDHGAVGRQVARMMKKVMRGIRPSDIPVESAESFMTINMRAARDLGLRIPDEVLEQTDHIVR